MDTRGSLCRITCVTSYGGMLSAFVTSSATVLTLSNIRSIATKKIKRRAPLAHGVSVHVLAPRRDTWSQKFWLVKLGHHVAEKQHRGPHCRVRQGHLLARQKGSLVASEVLEEPQLRLQLRENG